MGHRITLDVGRDALRFADENGPLSLPASCRLGPGPARRLRWSLFETHPQPIDVQAGAYEVAVFDTHGHLPAGRSRFHGLIAVLQQGLLALVSRRTRFFRIKPDVLVRVEPAAAEALGGYHEELLLLALRLAGARSVLFLDGAEPRPAYAANLLRLPGAR